MRNAFAQEIETLAAADPRVVLLSGDIGNRMFDRFKQRFPNRFYNCGIAEANMIGVAAGLAMSGLRPIAYTIAPFITARCLEQIRVDLCYHEQPVVIAGVGGGLCYASLGATHQSCEDIAMLRTLPNMTVVCPGDAYEVRAGLAGALQLDGPSYLRLGKKGEPLVHDAVPSNFKIGRALQVREGDDVCLLSTGNLLPTVCDAADLLNATGLSTQVFSFHTVKPLDRECLAEQFERYSLVVTLEEHSLLGGFGGAVAEWRNDHAQLGFGELLRLGTPDNYPHESRDQNASREAFGLTPEHIASRITSRIASNIESAAITSPPIAIPTPKTKERVA